MDGVSREKWEEEIESSLKTFAIGGRIRRLRLKRSMGLIELSRRTGLSASFLSQLETGRVIPTLRNLSRIALVFQQDLQYFFKGGQQNTFRISRQQTRSRLVVNTRKGSMISESMSVLIPDRSVIPCIAEFPLSDTDSIFVPQVFEGEEFSYVIAGSVTFLSGDREETLFAGDVLWTEGIKREYRCNSGQNAKVMIVTCPRTPHD